MSRYDNSRSVGVAWTILFALLLIAMYVLAVPAKSQVAPQGCAKTKDINALLTGQYGEIPAFAGISKNGIPVLVYTNPKTGSFTITMRQRGGITCMMTGGTDWTAIEQPKQGTDL